MFEGQHELSRRRIVQRPGGDSVMPRRFGQARRAQRPLRNRTTTKRPLAGRAAGFPRNLQFRPARGAQPVLPGNTATAQRTSRRKDQIDNRCSTLRKVCRDDRSQGHAARSAVLALDWQARQSAAMPASAPPRIFDPARRMAARHRSRWMSQTVGAARFILDDMIEDITDRLGFMRAEPARCLLIGDTSSALADALTTPGRDIISADPLSLDEEQPLPFGPCDLIVSLSSLDTVNDLPGALIHIRNALAPGGLMMASFPAAGSLPVLRQAMYAADGERPAARLHPMVDNRAGAELMQRSGFARQVVDSRTLQVSYRSLDQLVTDLRSQGLTSVLSSRTPPLSKSALAIARQAFMDHADDQGRVTETFEILTLTGWKT